MEVKSGKKVYFSGKCGPSEKEKYAKQTQDILNKIEDLGSRIAINSKPHLTTVEASIYLGISKHTLDSYASKKKISYHLNQNRRRYFLKEDLDKFAVNKENRVMSQEEIESEASLRFLGRKQ